MPTEPKKLTKETVGQGAAGLAARQRTVALANRHPWLWPTLNALTLDGTTDWIWVLERLQQIKTETEQKAADPMMEVYRPLPV